MKKIVFSLTLLLFVLKLFSQAPANPNFSKDHYLKKSKVEKIEAWVLLGGGATCIITSFLIPKGELITALNGGTIFGVPLAYSYYKNDNIKSTFGGIGFISMLTSIKFYLG